MRILPCLRPLARASILAGAALFLAIGAARAEPIQPDFPQTLPQPAAKPGKPGAPASAAPESAIPGARCIAAVVTEDIGTSDAYLYRELFLPPRGPQRHDGMAVPTPRALCPADAVSSAARNALIACRERATNPANCVYGDMDHNFMITTDVSDTSVDHSVVLAIRERFLGIACTPIAGIDVCSIAGGKDAAAAVEAAQARCKQAHGTVCVLTNAAPVEPLAELHPPPLTVARPLPVSPRHR